MHHKPDFFIIGVPKCGTTTLYRWLKDHSDIFMSEVKEPHYFAQNLSDRYCRVRDEAAYLDLFKDKKANQIAGEASVLYGFFPKSIQAILSYNPQAKIILMLRHPIDMIVSYHGQLLVNLEEDQKCFEAAWGLQNKRIDGAGMPLNTKDSALLQYGDIGRLGRHLQGALEFIPKGQLKVILLDDMAHKPKEVYEEILSFLDRKSDGRDIFEKENEATAIKYQWLEKIMRSQNPLLKFTKKTIKHIPVLEQLQNINQTKRIDHAFNPTFLDNLHNYFKDDVAILERYFGKKMHTKFERKS